MMKNLLNDTTLAILVFVSMVSLLGCQDQYMESQVIKPPAIARDLVMSENNALLLAQQYLSKKAGVDSFDSYRSTVTRLNSHSWMVMLTDSNSRVIDNDTWLIVEDGGQVRFLDERSDLD